MNIENLAYLAVMEAALMIQDESEKRKVSIPEGYVECFRFLLLVTTKHGDSRLVTMLGKAYGGRNEVMGAVENLGYAQRWIIGHKQEFFKPYVRTGIHIGLENRSFEELRADGFTISNSPTHIGRINRLLGVGFR